MFNKVFRKRQAESIEQSIAEMKFIGDVKGSGLNELRIEVASHLRRFPTVHNAYLSRLQYKSEDKPRICLAIDASIASEMQRQEIAVWCSGIVAMDILFLDSIPTDLNAHLKDICRPLFISGTNLFECPIVVGRGTNSDMPQDWKGAVICCYVAALDYQSALLVAADIVRSEGYEFKKVHDGKVNQLDPSKWWSGYVLEKWPSNSNYFPSQERMESIVATAAFFKGPALEWHHE